MRAIAVLAVFAFHVWPSGWFPGGYVGVDVFFVMSGFLITGLLLKEFESTGAISITRFYSQRIRRLLPAATLVLVAVACCIVLFPVSRWQDIARDIGASTLYFQNWSLAARAVDYLARSGPQSPLEHFWSLSVEEQYYFIWPLLALMSVKVTQSATRHPRAAFGVFVVIIGVGSLVYSALITDVRPGVAYFATTTRAWELALGGMLAIFTGWERWPRKFRAILGPVGIGLIVASCVLFTTDTVFPGYMALVPTVGAAMVIMCADCGGPLGVQRVLALKPFQYFGDISYSLYLWHWPVIVIYVLLGGSHIGWVDAIIIFVASVLLAHASKVYVEDRYRSQRAKEGGKRDWRPLRLAVACLSMSLVAAVAVGMAVPANDEAAKSTREMVANYPGALALTDGAVPANPDVPYLPTPVAVKDDYPSRSCHTGLKGTKIITCAYGSKSALEHVVLLGDSHADQWLPAFRLVAKQQGWHLTAMTKSACAFAVVKSAQFATETNKSCAVWNRKVLARLLKKKPDMVFISQSVYSLAHIEDKRPREAYKLLVQRMLDGWRQLAAAGISIFVIKDTPRPAVNVPDCLSSPGATIEGCSNLRSEALGHTDPLMLAAEQFSKAKVIDPYNAICGATLCRAVVGNVLVYRDDSHLSASYVKTLAPALIRKIILLEGGRRAQAKEASQQVLRLPRSLPEAGSSGSAPASK